jgi:heme/copper-type cytochrome/quinol oxidase subunit 2
MVVLIMMNWLIVLALATSPQAIGPSGPQDPSPETQDHRVIRVSAERFAFTPSEITVERGTVIEFHLTSDDTDHGFRIVGTDVNVAIPKRRRGEAVVTYVADTAGRFVIECSRPCGAGHTAMRATLVVK